MTEKDGIRERTEVADEDDASHQLLAVTPSGRLLDRLRPCRQTISEHPAAHLARKDTLVVPMRVGDVQKCGRGGRGEAVEEGKEGCDAGLGLEVDPGMRCKLACPDQR